MPIFSPVSYSSKYIVSLSLIRFSSISSESESDSVHSHSRPGDFVLHIRSLVGSKSVSFD